MDQENNKNNKEEVSQKQKIRIQPEEVCVPKCEPFKYDQIGREQTAKVLTRFIDNIDGPGVLAIDGSWGAGKTTFLKMWAQYLRKLKWPVVEFNAWETDFSDDPFVSLSTELNEGLHSYLISLIVEIEKLERKSDDDKEKINEIKKVVDKLAPEAGKLKKQAKEVARRAIPGVIRVATAGILDVSPLIEGEVSNFLSSYAEDRLNKYSEGKQSIKDFRETLKVTASTLLESTDSRPLVIVIDELDRCRPTYAIELLEVAKHLFNVDGIIFVLAINHTQLASSLQGVYGNTFDGEGYLRRFIDLDFPLTDPNPNIVSENTPSREKFINEILSTIKFDERTKDTFSEYSKEILRFFFKAPAFSLRRIARALLRLGVVLEHLPDKKLRFTQAPSVLLIIRTLDKSLYLRFVDGSITDREVADEVFRQLGIQRRMILPSPSRNTPDNSYAAEFEILLIAISHYSNLYNSNVKRNSNEEIALNSDLLRWHKENVAENNTDEASKQYSEDVVRMVTNLTTGDRHQSDFQRRIRREVDELKIAYELLELQSFEFYRNLIDGS